MLTPASRRWRIGVLLTALCLLPATPAAAQGYAPDSAALAPAPIPVGPRFLLLSDPIARRWGLQVGVRAPEVGRDAITPAAQAAIDTLVSPEGRPCIRFFLLEGRTLALVPNELTCTVVGFRLLHGEGTPPIAMADDSGTTADVVPTALTDHWLATTACPVVTVGADYVVSEHPCPAWAEEISEASSGETGGLSPETEYRRVVNERGVLASRPELRRMYRVARFSRGHDFCYLELPGIGRRAYECGWLWGGLADGVYGENPLPGTIRAIQGVNGGKLLLGGRQGFLIRVPKGTEGAAMVRLLEDVRVRFVEPVWSGPEGNEMLPGMY